MSNQLEPWLQFLKRKENIGLPIMEVKQKYLKEQLEFDDFVSQQNSILQGKANKIELVDNPPPPPFVGPGRYRDFSSNSCYYPSIEAELFDFGTENILTSLPYNTPIDSVTDGLNYSNTLNLTSTHYPVAQLKIEYVGFNFSSSNLFPLVSVPQGIPSVTLLPEFQGRENVLKMTVPAGFGYTQNQIELKYVIDTSFPEYRRPEYWNTHNWTYGIGFWSENGFDNPQLTPNWLFNGGGVADLLLGLSEYPDDDQNSAWIGNIPFYDANEWVDARVYKRDIIQGNSGGGSWSNFCHIEHTVPVGNPIGLDPFTTSYETNLYLSDWVWRVCPN